MRTRRICVKNQELYKLVIISSIVGTVIFDLGMICKEKLEAGHSEESKG